MHDIVAYVAGPYRAASESGVVANIRRAEEIAIRLWQMGVATICPHKNTALFGGLAEDKVWLEGDLMFLRRLRPGHDIICMVPGWEKSEGSCLEHVEAQKLGLYICYTDEDVAEWIATQEEKT